MSAELIATATRVRTALVAGSVALAAWLICGCATRAPPARTAAATPFAVDDYRLGTGDHIRVNVFNEPTLSGEFSIAADGSVALPLIGSVPASERTTTQLTAQITAKLAAGYLLAPRVSIDVLSYRPFYILGEVNKPGEYPYVVGLTVENAIATAAGLTYRGDRRRVYLKNLGGADEAAVPPTFRVRPGDTIRVGERYF